MIKLRFHRKRGNRRTGPDFDSLLVLRHRLTPSLTSWDFLSICFQPLLQLFCPKGFIVSRIAKVLFWALLPPFSQPFFRRGPKLSDKRF